MLDEKSNNYLACVYKDDDGFSLAWADITTGEFFVEEYYGELAIENCIGNLMKLSVAEIICNEEMLIAAAPNIGFISQPRMEINNPAANGMPMVPEVCIFFENKLLRGNRTTKVSA